MVKEILVCLEALASSRAALEFAASLAPALDARLIGLAVVDEPDIRARTAVSIGGASFKRWGSTTRVLTEKTPVPLLLHH